MRALEQFLALLFGAIVVGLVVSNPEGVKGILQGFASFTGETVQAFSGFGGGIGGTRGRLGRI